MATRTVDESRKPSSDDMYRFISIQQHIDGVCIECPINQRDTDRICEKCPVRLLSEKADGYLTESRPERISHWCDALDIEPEDIIL